MTEEMVKTGNRVPKTRQWILGALTLAGGYIYGKMIFARNWYILLAAFTAVFVAAGLFSAAKKERIRKKDSLVWLLFTGAAGLWILLYGGKPDQDICGYVILFLHAAGVYWIMVLSESRLDGCLDERGLLDLMRGLFVIPITHFEKWFCALGNFLSCILKARRKASGNVKQAAAGVLLSIPVICIVLPLLMGADEGFRQMVAGVTGGLSQWLWGVWDWSTAILWVFAILVSCYLFGLFFGAFENQRKEPPKRASLPAAMLTAFTAVILIVYSVFFLTKLAGIPQAMADIQEGTLLRSTYARNGFFELCWIASINFAVFSLVNWYWPAGKDRKKQIALSILGIQTLGFILLALFRMGFYIAGYGLTFKRVFTTWFMVVLLAAFVLMTIGNWKKLQSIRISVLFGCASFLLLAYSNIPAWAAG